MGIKIFLFFLFVSLFSALQGASALAAEKSYVILLGAHSHVSRPDDLDMERIRDSHHELLGSCIGSKEKAKEAIFYSYTRHFNGFAATLEEEAAAELSRHPKVISVLPNQVRKLHTTRSWEFMGLERNGEIPVDSLWRKANYGEGIIIATFDTGVWPESPSFNDEGMGPIPAKWKGQCKTNDGVKCNSKLIGASYFNKGYESAIGHKLNSSYQTARDYDGHGTHTLSTAGGSFVSGANFLGSAYGTAKGGAPKARVASYKVCWPKCPDADTLSAFESAIDDGVDVISISTGSGGPQEYFTDLVAVGAFYAVQIGIPVVMSAGNEGPTPGIISNTAPWIITVAASTVDRDYPSYVILGNNKQFKGKSLYSNTIPSKRYYPLVNSVDVKADNASAYDAKFCLPRSLDPMKVKGKIVYCTSDQHNELTKSWVVSKAGGVGLILGNQFINVFLTAMPHLIPTSVVSAVDGLSILTYIYSTKSPVAYISGSTEVGMVAAPIMASFSSPGPNVVHPEILKPDITAPGFQILAAYSEAAPPYPLPIDKRRLPYNIISGTSMSCPHISGIVALLRVVHPDWSPSAIKSAIMTTALPTNNVRQPIANFTLFEANPFNYGAGHVRPNRAVDPGLVYDLTTKDYLNFLCSVGYNSTKLSRFTLLKQYKCPSNNSPFDFNYPSISVPNLSGKLTLSRTLKNVGTPGLYRVHVDAPEGISVKVTPESLEFSKLHEEKTFKVTLQSRGSGGNGNYVFGSLAWFDGEHHVRSPIVVNKAAKKD